MTYQPLTDGQRYAIAFLYGEPFSLSESGWRTGGQQSPVTPVRTGVEAQNGGRGDAVIVRGTGKTHADP